MGREGERERERESVRFNFKNGSEGEWGHVGSARRRKTALFVCYCLFYLLTF